MATERCQVLVDGWRMQCEHEDENEDQCQESITGTGDDLDALLRDALDAGWETLMDEPTNRERDYCPRHKTEHGRVPSKR
jgi:hypothetical protein